MEGFREACVKMQPQELFDKLLELNNNYKRTDPNDQATLNIITAKISVLQDLIATLTLRPERAEPLQPSTEKDSLIRRR